MEPLLSLSCADEARRLAIAESLVRGGFELVDDVDDLAALHILDDAEIVLIRNHDETLIELTAAASPEDILALVRVCLEVTTLWDVVRSFEDCESAGVIAATIGQDASNALVPALFAAEALTANCPGNADLIRMVIQGCKRAMQLLERITPASRAAAPTPTCTNLVISELVSTMRAVARSTKLVTRLETPLPPTLIERAELERMLLTLVAHATETRRSERVVVATTACTVKIPDPLGAPPGDWVVIEVQDDGEAMPVEVRDGALRPTFTVQPAAASSCLGLPSIARITRSLGGHFAIDDRPRGTTVALWLPRAD